VRLQPGTGDPPVLRRERLFLDQYADHYGFRCVGAGALFRVSTLDLANLPRTPEGKVDFAQDFFGREAFLTVSGQLNVEAYRLAPTKVYTFGPTFRAENSNTSRHLAEFWMIEPEIAFADLSDNAALAEALLKSTFAALLNEREEDLAFSLRPSPRRSPSLYATPRYSGARFINISSISRRCTASAETRRVAYSSRTTDLSFTTESNSR
jgi:aspartyl/asparaginyl-tRNA synthetase